MKILHLISGGDVGGAKTHVLSLLEGLGKTQTVRLVCFMDGPFAQEARELGYSCVLLTDCLCCEAREAGRFLSAVARTHAGTDCPLAFLAGGETVVHLTGHGRGGRNQELALAAAEGLAGLPRAAVFSFGSDGTDGPTDAAGGYVDQDSLAALRAAGTDPGEALRQNDAYPALASIGGLIMTGPTGTNVNDLAVVLLGR